MLKTLVKKQLLEIFQTYFINKKDGKARTKKGTVSFFVLLAFLFIILGFAFYSMAAGVGVSILGKGSNWLYFSLMGLLSIALGVFGSVFNTYASLYLPKDNELLLSLPIPGYKLMLARMTGVYVTSLMYSAWIWIPAIIAYWVLVPLNARNVIFPILLTFIIGLFVSVLSCALGWVVAAVASKVKNKSFITVFLSLMIMVIYYLVYFKISEVLSSIINNIDKFSSIIRSWLYYVYILGMAADGNILSMLLVTVITALLACACLFVISKTFMKFVFQEDKSTKKSRKQDAIVGKSVDKALLHREFKQFTSIPVWMLNGGLGILILPAVSVIAVVKSSTIQTAISGIGIPNVANMLPILFMAAICIVVSTNIILPAAISIEGKNLWILQSLPVDPWKILRAKERMGVLLDSVPAVVSVLLIGIAFKFKILETVLLLIAVLMYILLISDFGLLLNLLHPNLRWTNAAVVVKQGLPAFVYLFGGWLFGAVLGIAGFLVATVTGTQVALGSTILLLVILWLLAHKWLKNKGTRIFSYL